MCVGLSAKVIKITDGTALVDASGAKRNISVELLEDLEPGDVIIKWSDHNNSGHAWMYAGGDQIVEAVPAKSERAPLPPVKATPPVREPEPTPGYEPEEEDEEEPEPVEEG